jgi:hypothetical protein
MPCAIVRPRLPAPRSVQTSGLGTKRDNDLAHRSSSMSSETTRELRAATLKLSQGADMPVLTARMPPRATADEFGRTAKGAFDLISKLTGHPCMSGRIKFVVDDLLLGEVTRVDLRSGELMPG